MPTRMSLSGESLLKVISDHMKTVPDFRDPLRTSYDLSDFLMSGFAIFSMKMPSLLKFEEEVRNYFKHSHLSMYDVSKVPSDTRMREVLDEISPDHLKKAYSKLFSKAQRSKHVEAFGFVDGKYILSVDGSGYFSSEKVHCESCMVKKRRSGEVRYHHQMLCGSIVHPDKKTVIPVCPEPITKQDGETKNDCEQNALRRFLDQFRNDHPQLPTILTADALHSTGPLIRDLKFYNMSYILSVKPGSHSKLFEGIEKREGKGKTQHMAFEEEIGDKIKKKRIHEFRFANGILLNHSHLSLSVNFLDYWETIQWANKKGELKEKKVRFSWVTDFELTQDNVMKIMRGGRARWKIENETFNTLKNQGYEFEHNFGHGNKNLSNVFAHLMMLAFLFDQLQEIGCEIYQKALKLRFGKRSRLWEYLRSLFEVSYDAEFKFSTWNDFIEFIVLKRGDPNTS